MKVLIHHGIRGQKWGVKNGPPYPLDPEDHNASERKAGWKKSLDGGSGSNKDKKKPGILGTYAAESNIKTVDKELVKAKYKNQLKISKKQAKLDKLTASIKLKLKEAKETTSKDRYSKLKAKEEARIEKSQNRLKREKEVAREIERIYKNYRNVQVKYLEDKAFKKSPEYKQAVNEFIDFFADKVYNGYSYAYAKQKLPVYVADKIAGVKG